MNKLSKSLVVALCCVPLLAACGKTTEKHHTSDPAVQNDANTVNGKSKLNTAKAVIGKHTLSNMDAATVKPMLTNILNQDNEITASQKTGTALKNVFNKKTQGVYFPASVHKGTLQQATTNVRFNIPNQNTKATAKVANHFIFEVFNNQLVVRPTHTLQGITGLTGKNATATGQEAQMLNSVYGDLIIYRIREGLPKDEIQAIRYVPMKILSTKTDNNVLTKNVLMNQQMKLKNGSVKAQNVVMKLNYSTGKRITTNAKIDSETSKIKTPSSQTKAGSLISFSLSDDSNTVNILNDKLSKSSIQKLVQSSITDVNNSNSRPKLD